MTTTVPEVAKCKGKHSSADEIIACKDCARFLDSMKYPEVECPKCNSVIWDFAKGCKLAKCWKCGTAFN